MEKAIFKRLGTDFSYITCLKWQNYGEQISVCYWSRTGQLGGKAVDVVKRAIPGILVVRGLFCVTTVVVDTQSTPGNKITWN